MVSALTALNWLLPLLYLALLIDYGITFFLRSKVESRNAGLVPVLCVHVLFLLLWSVQRGRPPLSDTYELLSVLALSTAVVYAVVEFAVHDRRTGMFVFLLVFLFQYTSSCALAGRVPVAQAVVGEGQSTWSRLHVVPALVSYTAAAIAAVYGLLHLTAQHGLKRHRFGVLFDRLPSLDLLGKMTWYALLCSFVFMTVAVITGPILSSHAGSQEQSAVLGAKIAAKIVIGLVAWIIYGGAVVGRFWKKWPATRISLVAVTGFVVIMILFVVSGILSP